LDDSNLTIAPDPNDPSTAVISVTAQSEVGKVRVRLRATDTLGATNAVWLVVPINEPNNAPPTITSDPYAPSGAAIVFDEGEVYGYDVVAEDPENDAITYTAE